MNKKKRKKYTKQDVEAIKEFICKQKDKLFKISDVAVSLNQTPKSRSLSNSTIRRIMKNELHMSYK